MGGLVPAVLATASYASLLIMLMHCLYGLCAFPNIATDLNIAMKQGKKNRHDEGSC